MKNNILACGTADVEFRQSARCPEKKKAFASGSTFMRKNNLGSVTMMMAALLLGAHSLLSRDGAGPVSNVDELVAHHLDSLGNSKVRANVKTRVAQGTAAFKFLVGGAGSLD